MMDRKAFVARMAVGLFVAPRLRAQRADKVFTIGVLSPGTEPTPSGRIYFDALIAALRDLGWVEGRNLTIETRFAGFDPKRQRELAAELKAMPVALIVAAGTTTIRAARDGAPGVPVVMVNAGDPVGAGLVASLARPGGDLTGTSAAGQEVLAKQLELLSAAAPQLRRASALMNSVNPANGFFFEALSARARTLGLQLDRIEVTQADELDAAVARAKGGTLVVLGDPMFYRERGRIIELTQRLQMPSIYGGRDYVAAGGLMSYLSSNTWHWRTAAGFVDKILRGTKPADLPVEQPTQFDLIINLKTARAIGLTIPPSLLQRADEVIE